MRTSVSKIFSHTPLSGTGIPLRTKQVALMLIALCALTTLTPASYAQEILPDCPETPNCVSSQATDPEHLIAPLQLSGDAGAAKNKLTALLDSLPRVSWQTASDKHIKATFTSFVFRFIDDVDFVINDNNRIDVRSASRVGRSDFGANRRRIEEIRAALEKPITK